MASELASKGGSSFPHHTLIKIALDELEEILSEEDEDATNRKIKEIDRKISNVLQEYPGDQYILESESRFCQMLDDHPRALAALQKAFQQNKKSAFIASRLAKMYEHKSLTDEAIQVLRECIEENPYDKDLNFQIAMLMITSGRGRVADILHSLRISFTMGDTRYEAQFWYARTLYVAGDFQMAFDGFKRLRDVDVDNRLKKVPRARIIENGQPIRFEGEVIVKEFSHGFIRRDRQGDKVFLGRYPDNDAIWNELKTQRRISFELAFNFYGPIAVSIIPKANT